jgi:hypothetical protein
MMIVALWHMTQSIDTVVAKFFTRQHGVKSENIWTRQHRCENIESWKYVYFSNTEKLQSVIYDCCFIA